MSTVLSTDMIMPLILVLSVGYALYKRLNVFAVFIEGAKEGLTCAFNILPALCFLMTAIGMLRASGVFDLLGKLPIWETLGFPPEVVPLALLRPFSGSGALAYYGELCETVPADSFAERVASVLMGGSETTFYTLAVYYGAVGIKNTANTLPSALFADFAAAVLSVLTVNIFF